MAVSVDLELGLEVCQDGENMRSSMSSNADGNCDDCIAIWTLIRRDQYMWAISTSRIMYTERRVTFESDHYGLQELKKDRKNRQNLFNP